MTTPTQLPFALPAGMATRDLTIPKAIRLAIRLLHPDPAAPVNIRAKFAAAKPGTKPDVTNVILSSGDAARYILKAVEPDAGCEACWITLNPLIAEVRGPSVHDYEVARRLRLLVDFDPVRPPGTNSTEAERAVAGERLSACLDATLARGWPLPAIGMSGNGYQAIWGIELPNAPESRDLVKATLARLDQVHGGDGVDVDTSVFNASRVVKVWGTLTRKGPHSEERPQRRSMPVAWPEGETLAPIPAEALREFAAELLGPIRRSSVRVARDIPQDGSDVSRLAANTAKLLRALGVPELGVRREERDGDPIIKLFVECPNIEEHSTESTGESAVLVHRNEAGHACRSYVCFHDHCQDLCDWKAFIRTVEEQSALFDETEEVGAPFDDEADGHVDRPAEAAVPGGAAPPAPNAPLGCSRCGKLYDFSDLDGHECRVEALAAAPDAQRHSTVGAGLDAQAYSEPEPESTLQLPPAMPATATAAPPTDPMIASLAASDDPLDRAAAELAPRRRAERQAAAVHAPRRSVTRAEAIASAAQREMDFPRDALHGPLGEIALGTLTPLGLSYPAAVTIFSAIPGEDTMAGTPLQMFTALVAPVGCGKDTAIDRTLAAFPERVEGIWTMRDVVSTTVAASDRGLINILAQPKPAKAKRGRFAAADLPDELPERPKPRHRLLMNHELASMLDKAAVEHSTLLSTLCSLYDHGADSPAGVADRDGERAAAARLSLLGGIPASAARPERFQELFGTASCRGLYSRMCLGYADVRKYYGDDGWIAPRPVAAAEIRAIALDTLTLDWETLARPRRPSVANRMPYAVVESLAPGAERLLRELWDRLMIGADDDDEAEHTSRLVMLARKWAVLTASAAGERVVTEECVAKAVAVAGWQLSLRRRFAPGHAVTPGGRLVERIFAAYRSLDPGEHKSWRTLSSRRKWHAVAPSIDAIPRTIDAMVRQGLLVPEYEINADGEVAIKKIQKLRLPRAGENLGPVISTYEELASLLKRGGKLNS